MSSEPSSTLGCVGAAGEEGRSYDCCSFPVPGEAVLAAIMRHTLALRALFSSNDGVSLSAWPAQC